MTLLQFLLFVNKHTNYKQTKRETERARTTLFKLSPHICIVIAMALMSLKIDLILHGYQKRTNRLHFQMNRSESHKSRLIFAPTSDRNPKICCLYYRNEKCAAKIADLIQMYQNK